MCAFVSLFISCLAQKRIILIKRFEWWLYLGALLADQPEIRKGDEESHADIGHMTKMAIFANSLRD